MISRLYPKQYTRKEWNRFTWEIQEALCKRYNVVLVEKTKDGKIIPAKQSLNAFLHQDKKDIAVQVGKTIYHNMNKKNLDKSIGMIHKSTDQLSNFTNKIGSNKRRNFF